MTTAKSLYNLQKLFTFVNCLKVNAFIKSLKKFMQSLKIIYFYKKIFY